MATDLGTPHIPKDTVDGSSFRVALAYFFAVAKSNATPHYSNLLWLVDDDGNQIEDLTPYVVMNSNTPPSVTHDSTLDGVQGQVSFTYRRPTELQWGSARVKPWLLVQCDDVGGGQWYRFPLGVYIVTSPGKDLQDAIERDVTGFDKCYLLMSDQSDSLGWGGSTLYADAVADVFIAAGLIATRADLPTVITYGSTWAAKTIPADQFRSYALSGSAQSYLSIVNALLADSGQQNLWLDADGNFQISDLPTPQDDAYLWTWVADQAAQASAPAGDYTAKVVLREQRAYNGDVYNIPNQWVFIQSGLTTLPLNRDGSDGMYIVDNTTRPPSDQTSTGRIIRHTEWLDASGQDDLVAQGDSFVSKALNAVETIKFSTAPWRVGWHYDVFFYADSGLPGATTRRVQTQRWTLPLNGQPMTWDTNVVGTM